MYRKTIVAVLCMAGYAWGEGAKCVKPPSKPPVSTPKPSQSPTPPITQNQSQGQSQSQTSEESAEASASAGGGNVNTSSVYKEVRQTPFAFSPTIIPSDCQRTLTGGASSPIAALSLGGSRRDRECEALRLAHVFIELGNYPAASKVICATDSAKRAKLTIEECQAIIPPLVISAPVEQVASPPQIIVPAPAITINIPPVASAPIDPSPKVTPKRVVEVDPKRKVAKKTQPACPVVK